MLLHQTMKVSAWGSQPGTKICIEEIISPTVSYVHACVLTQLCLTFCNPMDCSPPDFSVHGILQARILEWVDMPSSRESSWLREYKVFTKTGQGPWLRGDSTLGPQYNKLHSTICIVLLSEFVSWNTWLQQYFTHIFWLITEKQISFLTSKEKYLILFIILFRKLFTM